MNDRGATRLRIGRAAVAILLWAGLAPVVLAAEAKPRSIPTIERADRVEALAGGKLLFLGGNVKLVWGDRTLEADSILVWPEDGEGYLEGHVRFTSPTMLFRAEKASVQWRRDPETKRLKLTSGFMQGLRLRNLGGPGRQPYQIQAPEAVQIGPREYVARQAWVSTCTFAVPHHRLATTETHLHIKEEVTVTPTTEKRKYRVQELEAWGGVYFLDELPVFYLPYYRRNGVSLHGSAELGRSSRLGTFLLTDWNLGLRDRERWPYGDWKWRMRVDHMSRRGEAYGLDANYYYGPKSHGRLSTYRVPDDEGEDDSLPLGQRDRWRIKYQHMERSIDDLELDIEFQKYSDRGFREEYFEEEFYEDKFPETRLWAKYFRDNWAVTGHAKLRANPFFDQTEYLPEFAYHLFDQPMGKWLLYTTVTRVGYVRRRLANVRRRPFDTDASLLQREIRYDAYDRPSPLTVNELYTDRELFLRFDTEHVVSRPFQWDFVNVRPFVGVRQTWYGDELQVNESQWRGQFLHGVDLTTQIHRTYDVFSHAFSINQLRHIFTPEIRYVSEKSPTSGRHHFPQADAVDTRNGLDAVTFALRNRLQTFRNQEIVNFLDWDLELIYYPHKQRDNANEPFSMLRTDFRFYPFQGVTLNIDGEWNPNSHGPPSIGDFEVFNIGLSFGLAEDWTFFVGNRYEHEESSTTTLGFDSALNEKWSVGLLLEYDWRTREYVQSEVRLRRSLHDFHLEVAFSADFGEDNRVAYINLVPRGATPPKRQVRFIRSVAEARSRWELEY